ncbi:MAG: hypothetical protein LBB13_01860 [Rickettsiales bacterium]|jgi:type IV secretion system protein VirB10|nr:hypothetical protein [Rickettsiales bacterium]
MTDKNNSQKDPVVVENDPVVNVEDTGNSSISENKSGGNVKYITIAVSIVASLAIYMLFFSSGGKKDDIIDERAIVKDNSENPKVNSSAVIDNIDNLADVGYRGDIYIADGGGSNILDLPELPQLPEGIVKNIEQELKDAKKSGGEGVFTKKEVDEMINSKLKNFENEMKRIKNESERLARELEDKKRAEEENSKKPKVSLFSSIGGLTDSNSKATTSPDSPATATRVATTPAPVVAAGTTAVTSTLPLVTPPGVSPPNLPAGVNSNNAQLLIEMEEAEKLAEQKKQEDRELQIAQRRRIMEERKGSPMFKMQGGGGGRSADSEQDSIIITDKDSLTSIRETKLEVITTKNSDLSRTVLQGKIINAILETAINTDIKTPVRAIISRDVYSESGKNIVIPKGSKVIGSFQTMANNNLSRLEIIWNRIIRTDGLSINIAANSADTLGRGGVDGELDNKYVQTMKNVFLSSMISIANAVLMEKVTGSVGTTTTTNAVGGTTTTGKASDQVIINAAKNITDEMQTIVDGLKIETPTIRIAQGTRINIVVNQDLSLPIYSQKR